MDEPKLIEDGVDSSPEVEVIHQVTKYNLRQLLKRGELKVFKPGVDTDIPQDYKHLHIRFEGLTLTVSKLRLNDKDEVVWEMHFGIEGVAHRQKGPDKNINDIKTFIAMHSDLKELSGIVEKYPSIRPLGDENQANWRTKALLIDAEKFQALLKNVKDTKHFRDFYSKYVKSKPS